MCCIASIRQPPISILRPEKSTEHVQYIVLAELTVRPPAPNFSQEHETNLARYPTGRRWEDGDHKKGVPEGTSLASDAALLTISFGNGTSSEGVWWRWHTPVLGN